MLPGSAAAESDWWWPWKNDLKQATFVRFVAEAEPYGI